MAAALLAIIVCFSLTCFATITFAVNGYMLFSIFVTKKIHRNHELTLFYARFAIDMMFSVADSTYALSLLSRFLNLWIPPMIQVFVSLVFTLNFMSMRAFLVMVITFDRVLAVYTPIKYKVNRKKLSNFLILLPVVGYWAWDNFVLWGFCGYTLFFPDGCINFSCIFNDCYVTYWLGYEQSTYVVTGLLSLLMFTKLFIWNYCTGKQKNAVLSRANKFALIDVFIVCFFDFIPTVIYAANVDYAYDQVGPANGMIKALGYAIEGCMIAKVLMRNNSVRQSSVMVSGGTGKT